MAVTLAFLEATALFGAVGVVIVLWTPMLFNGDAVAIVLLQTLAVSLCCLLSFYYHDLYDLRIVRSFSDFAPRLLQSLGVAFILLAACYTLFPSLRVSGKLSVAILLLVAGLVLSLRAVSYGVLRKRPAAQRVLVLGTSPLAVKIADEIEAAPLLRYSLIGVVDDSDTRPRTGVSPLPGRPYLMFKELDEVALAIRELKPDRIVVALTERRGRLPVWGLLSSCVNGVIVEDGIQFYERMTHKLAIESLSPSALIFSRVFRRPRPMRMIRRLFSVTVSLVGFVLTLPVMALAVLLIKLESKGPALFIQERAGLGGKPFRLYKFRTMRGHGPGGNGDIWQRDDRSRVTPLGQLLRRLRIDELPQFWNILRGDMDLVGPRPEMAVNVATMNEQIPYYFLRHSVRPGVTGWAQVKNGYSVSREEVTEKLRYDLYYIKNMSFWLDLRILVDTVKIVVVGWGAR